MLLLLGQVRPDRQTLLFSATFKPNLERLARDVLTEPVRVTVGEVGDANEDVTQIVEVLDTAELKWGWLHARLEHFVKQARRSSAHATCRRLEEGGATPRAPPLAACGTCPPATCTPLGSPSSSTRS